MGIQIWTSDQSPQIRMAGANALAEGIGRAGQSLGDSLGKAMEEKKRQGQLASSLRKTLSVAFPDRKDEFNTMGLPDLQGELEGQALASARQRQQQQQASLAASLQAQAEERANAARFPAFAQAIGEMGQAPEAVPGPLNNAEFDRRTRPVDLASVLAAAGRTGYRPNEGSLDDLMRAIASSGGQEAGPLTFDEDPVSGNRFARRGNTVLPSGMNPGKMTTVTVTDPNTGEPVELTVNPKTGQPVLKPKPPQNVPRVSPDFTKSLGELAIGLDDPKNGPKVRSGIKAMIDSAHTLKQLDGDQRDALYQQFGIGGTSNGGAAAPSADAELKLAQDALAKGVAREKVAAKYKQRTGKDLPP